MKSRSQWHAQYLNPLEWARAGIQANSFEQAWGHADARLRALGFHQIGAAFALPQPAPLAMPTPRRRVGTMISTKFEDFHQCHPVAMMKDPYVRQLARSNRPVFYLPDHVASIKTSSADDDYLDWAELEFGVRGGLGFPVHDRQRGVAHVVSLTTVRGDTEFGRLFDEFVEAIHRAIIFFFEGVTLTDIRNAPNFRDLSARERSCLTWCSVGKTTSEIADLLSISDSTVNEYLANAIKKLGASNRAHACARAALLDIIQP